MFSVKLLLQIRLFNALLTYFPCCVLWPCALSIEPVHNCNYLLERRCLGGMVYFDMQRWSSDVVVGSFWTIPCYNPVVGVYRIFSERGEDHKGLFCNVCGCWPKSPSASCCNFFLEPIKLLQVVFYFSLNDSMECCLFVDWNVIFATLYMISSVRNVQQHLVNETVIYILNFSSYLILFACQTWLK